MKTRLTAMTLGMIALWANGFPTAGAQEQHDAHHAQPQAAEKETPSAPSSAMMMEKCQMMAEHMAAMKKEQAAMDEKLEELVEHMNSSQRRQRVDAIVEVVNELASLHRKMRHMHEAMQQTTMSHMCEHMMQSMNKEASAKMMQCPMMKSMTPSAESPAEHQGHEHAEGNGPKQ